MHTVFFYITECEQLKLILKRLFGNIGENIFCECLRAPIKMYYVIFNFMQFVQKTILKCFLIQPSRNGENVNVYDNVTTCFSWPWIEVLN